MQKQRSILIWHSTNKRCCIIIMNEHIIYYYTAILNTSRCTKGKSKHVYKCIYSSCIKVLQVRRVTLRVGSCSRHRSLSKCTTKVWSVPYNLHVHINIYIYHLRDFYPSSSEQSLWKHTNTNNHENGPSHIWEIYFSCAAIQDHQDWASGDEGWKWWKALFRGDTLQRRNCTNWEHRLKGLIANPSEGWRFWMSCFYILD